MTKITMIQEPLVKFVSDNEWQGKYELLEGEYKEDGLQIISLGDNLPTGRRKDVGGLSHFKTEIKKIQENIPDVRSRPLIDQLQLVYDVNPEEFMKNYAHAPNFVAQGVNFLNNSALEAIIAIPGNREAGDIDALFQFLKQKGVDTRITYMEYMSSVKKFDLYTEPGIIRIGEAGILLVPYSTDHQKMKKGVDNCLDALNDIKPEHFVIGIHENPTPQRFGIDRPLKTEETIDYTFQGTKKIAGSKGVLCLCGHLDTKSEAYMHNGIMVQPLSGQQTIIYNGREGMYKINEL